jgi:hypothetical protein
MVNASPPQGNVKPLISDTSVPWLIEALFATDATHGIQLWARDFAAAGQNRQRCDTNTKLE